MPEAKGNTGTEPSDIFPGWTKKREQLLLKRQIFPIKHLSIARLMDYGCPKRSAVELIKLYPDAYPNIQNKKQQSFFIHGTAGSGKTLYAMALALASKAPGMYSRADCIFITLEELLVNFKSAQQNKLPHGAWREKYLYMESDSDRTSQIDPTKYYGSEEEYLYKIYRKAQFLIIDDVGMEKGSEWTRQIFQGLINYRYGACLPTIITSNHNPTEHIELTGSDRIISRFIEMGGFIELTGQYRK